MNVAVLLFYCNDNPRETGFTRDWAEKAVQVTGDYLAAQSAGRVTVTWQVFEWVELDMTAAQWIALSAQGITSVLPVVQAQLGDAVDLDGFDHYLVGIDVQGAGGGTTPGNYTYLAAQNFSHSSDTSSGTSSTRTTRSAKRPPGRSDTAIASASWAPPAGRRCSANRHSSPSTSPVWTTPGPTCAHPL
jgi:hypothetical protein